MRVANGCELGSVVSLSVNCTHLFKVFLIVSLSTALGVNPIIAEDFTIQNAPALLSPTSSSVYDPALSLLLDKLKMARVGARITGLLSSCPNSSSGLAEVGDNLAIFRILQGDVQEVEANLLNTDGSHPPTTHLWSRGMANDFA